MYIEVDLSTVPPALALREAEVFTMFKVVVKDADHVWADLDQITAVAGGLADDPQWRAGFDGMVEFAREHGYIDEQGRMRGHVEHA